MNSFGPTYRGKSLLQLNKGLCMLRLALTVRDGWYLVTTESRLNSVGGRLQD